MVALILAVGMLQASSAELRIAVTVVRPDCVVVDREGAASWSPGHRPGPDSVHCIRSSSPSPTAPRIVPVTAMVERQEFRIIEINH